MYGKGNFVSWSNPPADPELGEVNSGEDLVEHGGYIPLRKYVPMSIQAGQVLEEIRKGFQYPDTMVDMREVVVEKFSMFTVDALEVLLEEKNLHAKLNRELERRKAEGVEDVGEGDQPVSDPEVPAGTEGSGAGTA
jgi:hypothetical protein